MKPAFYNTQISKSELISADPNDESSPKVRAYYKHEMAKMYNVCTKTFSAWMHMYFEELRPFGYTIHTKLLRPEIVRFLFERLGEP